MDLEVIRWKTADNLTPQEIDFLVENKEKLNDEEKAAFSDLIQAATPLPENPLESIIDETVNTPEPPAAAPVVPEPPAPIVPDNVITQDNLDAYMEEKRKQWDEQGKTKAEQAAEIKELKLTIFQEGELPADWNQAVNKFAPAIIEEAEKRILAKLDARNQEYTDQQAKIKASQQEIFNRFEGEFATLAKNKLIPDPKENPEEYKKTHEAILKIGDENGKSNVTDAYKLWSIIPEEHGGGFKTGNAQTAAAARIEAQKEAAGKIGSGRGVANAGKKGIPQWHSIHNTSLEDLLEQRLGQPT